MPNKILIPPLTATSAEGGRLTATPLQEVPLTPLSPGQTSVEPPKIKVLAHEKYVRMPWKNGLGETRQIAIYPRNADFEADNFVWRLALSEVRDSCSFSVFPGYDIALLLLNPEADSKANTVRTRRNSITFPVELHHNDSAAPTPLRPLMPYTYNGEIPTTCRIRTGPIRHLTFFTNRKRTHVTANLETICLHGLTDCGECEQNEPTGQTPESNGEKREANPTSKMLLGNFAIIYVVSGTVKISVEGGELSSSVVRQGDTFLCERDDESSPTEVSMIPVKEDGTPYTKENEANHIDATVLIIQVNVLRPERRQSISDISGLRPRGRSGSIIVYDDQPFQTFSQSTASLDGNAPPMTPTSEGIQAKHWESPRHYVPPVFSARFKNESDVPPAVVRDHLNIEDFPVGAISTVWINMVKQGLSEWLRVPVIVARGKEVGPVVGITAVVHGNELNGVPCIHRVISDIDVNELKGTVVAVPCVNVPGYLRYTREFSDGKDLNRLFPGKPEGTASQIYAYNFMEKIVNQFNFLIDLHTASFGRVNSYYVRSDMNDPIAAAMAKLQQPQVILHNSGQDGALRSAAMNRGVKAITVEIGNPQLFQNQYVQWSYLGVMRILAWLKMFSMSPEDTFQTGPPPSTILCSKGFWLYTKTGGVLEVYPNVNSVVRKGDLIARIKNIFGNIVDEIYAPVTGVTIGRSSNPVAMAGDRVLHMGVIKREGEVLAMEAKENY
ncbi:hypothetical protein DFS34DRAFT_650538 [Phlyctochytrium arcticum]|nr:hypothetical protein DFS34DRAFT_650538 [Phlyctochytrium arcticum]